MEDVGHMQSLRPPAVPLVTCDPYFSVWSFADCLTDEMTRHWTGAPQPLIGLVRIDGSCYRLMGTEPRSVAAAAQTDRTVLPLRTIYRFVANGVEITLTFMTPLLPHDLEMLARPVTYLTWSVRATDGQAHSVALFFAASAALSVNSLDQRIMWSRARVPGLRVLRVGSHEQPLLEKAGDLVRIDWGFLYGAVADGPGVMECITGVRQACDTFCAEGRLPECDDLRMPRLARDDPMALSFLIHLDRVTARLRSRHLVLAYDCIFAVQYLDRSLRPYWRRNGAEIPQLLRAAEDDYAGLVARCATFDAEVMRDLRRVGGEAYAGLGALAFRQCLAAHTVVADIDGSPLFFSKENGSNGCMATVDVTYPTSPFLLLFNPELLVASLKPILEYAKLPRWQHPFAPHDIGRYPLGNGQVYGEGERGDQEQMPVEECGNLLLLVAAVAEAQGGTDFVSSYWPLLTRWAAYLQEKGFDPESQLCTDDFTGHLAHSTNLSLKAIVALAAYARLCADVGTPADAQWYGALARQLAARWERQAADDDHFRLAFDQPSTWGQKYNLVWDRLLGLDLFSPEVARREVAWYLRHIGPFGLPLDCRSDMAKLDWTAWSATLAESPADFRALVEPLVAFAHNTPDRVPLTDYYHVTDGRLAGGNRARSVVGALFAGMLSDPELRNKWRGRVVHSTRSSEPGEESHGCDGGPTCRVSADACPASSRVACSTRNQERGLCGPCRSYTGSGPFG